MSARLIIVDGRHLLWRMGDSHKLLHAAGPDGDVYGTGGIFGFVDALTRLHKRLDGVVAVAWEGRDGANFRRRIFPDYKKRRDDMTPEQRDFVEDLRRQERLLREFLSSAGVRQWEGVDCEGDDVIGVLADRASRAGRDVVIYGADGDLRQLVKAPAPGVGSVTCVAPGSKGEVRYDVVAVAERHGVEPWQIPHVKALMGDAGDDIPGVRGVGEKTATRLIQAYGNSETATTAAALGGGDGWPVPPRFAGMIAEQADVVPVCLQLATIRRDARVAPLKKVADVRAVTEKMREWKFKSMMGSQGVSAVMALGGAA